MAEYPSNSNKMREASLVRESDKQEITLAEEKPDKTERPTGIVRARKVSTVKEIFAALFPEGLSGIKEHLIWDLFVPRAQEFMHSSWDDLGNVIFQGNKPRSQNGSYTSYDTAYRRQNRRPVNRAMYDYQEVVWSTRSEAERLLRLLNDILRKYSVVTLLDYNDEVGNETNPGQSNYGWISLNTAHVERTYDGWVVVLPRPVEIDNRN